MSDLGVLWAAAAKGVRSPTPFDVDVQEKLGGIVYLTGNPTFTTEKVPAYELGYRVQPASFVSFSVSPFYNVYHDLRTIEFGPAADGLPLHWGNLMSGSTYGVSARGNIQLTDWWRLSPSFSVLHKNLRFDAGASAILGWHVSKSLELSLSGTNLLHAYHEEYPSPAGEEIGRGVMVGARWTSAPMYRIGCRQT